MTPPSGHDLPTLAGVDGCRAGWIALVRSPDGDCPRLVMRARFAELVEDLGSEAVIAVDMPIGLPDRISGPGRGPEQAVRRFLGARQSSVFSIPARAAVEAESYAQACELAERLSDPPKRVSKQAFFLFPKILEIDRLLRADPAVRGRIIECHPEFAFCRLNAMAPMSTPKKIRGAVNPDGIAERVALLARHGIAPELFAAGSPRGAGMDDLVDAAVNLVIAGRHARGLSASFPDPPGKDRFGIPVAIHA